MMKDHLSEIENALDAQNACDFTNTIAVLMDKRPGFDPASARMIVTLLRGNGYLVHEVTVSQFMALDLSTLGFLLLIPHAQSTPIEIADSLELYWRQGGQVLLLGGPLFGRRVEKEDGIYLELPLENGVLDAVHQPGDRFGMKGDRFSMEGVAPTHKVFFERSTERFLTETDQAISDAVLVSDRPEDVLCPVARPHGIGFQMERRNRMITIAQAMGPDGRGEGRRGAAAFLMLSNTRGHLVRTNGSRPGSVSATTPGSCVGGIGILRQDLLNVTGARTLVLDMVRTMHRGLYLYEAGADVYVTEPDQKVQLGARLLSLSQDFISASVSFTVRSGREIVFQARQEVLASARAYTDVSFDYCVGQTGNYEIRTELIVDSCVIDCIIQELYVTTQPAADDHQFIRAHGTVFERDGKPWRPMGINYWPLFYPSFDRLDYWMGWLDKANYDPLETERDLALMEKMKIDLVCTRMDGDVLGRSLDTLKDFIERCRRHGMRLMLSWVNAFNPLFYQPRAVEALLERTGLASDPVLFAYDISWETGPQLIAYIHQWDSLWREWVDLCYGSVEAAQRDWGVDADLDASGRLTHPPTHQLSNDGPWRVKICAYRRFLDNMVSRKWNDAVAHIRSLDPHHMVTFRGGVMPKHGGFYLTGTVKHVDFMALEGYTFEQCPEGLGGMICLSLLAGYLSGHKPVTWVEYGLNLIGNSGQSPLEALRWDRVHLTAYTDAYEAQREYNGMFFKAFKEAGVAGSAPWWYPGGFRRVELSDCGYVSPNGVPRSVWHDYMKTQDIPVHFDETREIDKVITLDPDATAQSWGRYCLGSGMVDRMERDNARVAGKPVDPHPDWGEGALACRDALAEGRHVAFRTPGANATSREMPMLAVGNVPLTGANPPKYLDAEFNWVTLTVDGVATDVPQGGKIAVRKGAHVKMEACVGNLREAKWLRLDENETGGVWLRARLGCRELLLPMGEDTPYLMDAYVAGTLTEAFEEATDIELRMTDWGISDFGEIWRFCLMEQVETEA